MPRPQSIPLPSQPPTSSPSPASSSLSTPPFPILLLIRFSASIADIPLEIPHPGQITGAGLKHLLRTHLPSHYSAKRLRLIYAGRAIDDSAPLWTSLRLQNVKQPPELPKLRQDDKGKRPEREVPRMKLWVHCSIGEDTLTEEELSKEEEMGSVHRDEERRDGGGAVQRPEQSAISTEPANAATTTTTTTTPAPRGFDRLLSAGFTPPEIPALRSQFLALVAYSRTPDTMPSGAELRELEDRWIDEGATSGGGGDATAGGGDASGGVQNISTADEGASERLNDMILGVSMGFFWPVGCGLWLLREEGGIRGEMEKQSGQVVMKEEGFVDGGNEKNVMMHRTLNDRKETRSSTLKKLMELAVKHCEDQQD
ncbi:hypothetical protein KEM56_006387 [Ascosphaera pollenicola]|nr:hypothetical protein KEM56_006387 [Ascosphaera pollenicola]